MDRLPADGYWWLPDSPEEQIPGQLTGEPGSIRLALLGSFGKEHLKSRTVTEESLRRPRSLPFVNGMVQGKEVTLFDVAQAGESFSVPGFHRFTYKPRYVLFGRLCADESPLAMSIELSHLLEWYGRSGLSASYTPSKGQLSDVDWSFRFPEPMGWNTPHYSVTLSSRLDVESPTNGFSARESAAFKVKANQETSIQQWMDNVVQPLQDLLKIAIWKPVVVLRMRPIFADQVGDSASGTLDEITCEIVQNRKLQIVPSEERLLNEELLFQASDLTDEILANILDGNSTQAEVRTSFLASEQELMTHPDRFLSYVRLLEFLHRRSNPVPETEKETYASKIEGILEKLSQEESKLIGGKLRFGYEPGLPARLHALCKPWKPLMVEVHGTKQDFSEELQRVAKHRDFMAHQLEDDQRGYEDKQLATVNLLLTAVTRLNVLRDVGFSVERAEKFISSSAFFKQYARDRRKVSR